MKHLSFIILISLLATILHAQSIISTVPSSLSFALVSNQSIPVIFVNESEPLVVKKSAQLLQQDIESVTGKRPSIVHAQPASGNCVILIGTIENSSAIRRLVAEKRLNVDKIRNKWEAYQIQTVSQSFKGISNTIVIAGSDARGAAYGVFELSKEIGVSPWYWWADVPVKKKSSLYIQKNVSLIDSPKVKYRGIFLNDEAPALSGWSKEKFGGFNHLFYEKVFELMLRLKSNYIWPAMWGNAFYDDDSLNIKSAEEYGIVIGTSHHEPLMRAHDEWRRYGKGIWNYDSNEVRLKDFWRAGMQRATNEKIVSVGMRGDGDKPMSEQTATALLERIVKDQRQIIEEVTGKPASATPQLWALYKEVQDYYDKGMRVPDDVTLLLCDDNWGNIRKLPKLNEKPRKGGYGIYYHFDYVGGPRNYKWINTNNIARVWEQMHLAWEYNARQIWIVNVGDLKPMEFPISFFLDYAWNPDKINQDNLREYYTKWASEQFGPEYAKEIGSIIRTYSQYNARRKPELLNQDTYDFQYDEFETVVTDYDRLLTRAEKINTALPAQYKDAYFQLVLHPVRASANLNSMYFMVGLNALYYRTVRNHLVKICGDRAKELYKNDSLITLQYHQLNNGKWNHIMDQTHIGYTYWQQPTVQKMPEIKYLPEDSIRHVDEDKMKGIPKILKSIPKTAKGNIFYEVRSYVSIEAEHYTRAINSLTIKWKVIPDIGRDGSGLCAFPVTASEQQLKGNSPHTEYDFYSYDSNAIKINAYFSPTLNFDNNEAFKYAISIDNEKPQIISINKEDNNVQVWGGWVANNIIIKTTSHTISKPGKHTVKFWMVSPAVVLQKMVLTFRDIPPSYLGPTETIVN